MPSPADRLLLQALESEGVLRAYLGRYAANSSDVDDLLQDTYARLLAVRPADIPQIRSVRAFALVIARNVALDWLRHRKVVPIEFVADVLALDVLDDKARVDEIVNAHQELELLAQAVAGLPRRCRQAFTLRRIYGMSQKDIAARLSISENTVEQLLAKAVRRCAAFLFEKQGVGASLGERLRRRSKRVDPRG